MAAEGNLMKRTIVVACLAILSSFARADYPDRPIRLVVPFAAGGGVDVLARAIGQRDVQHIPYKGTPRPILDKLNAEIDRALADPDVKRRLEDMGVVIQP